MNIILGLIVSNQIVVTGTVCFLASAFVDWGKLPWVAAVLSAIGISIFMNILITLAISILAATAGIA